MKTTYVIIDTAMLGHIPCETVALAVCTPSDAAMIVDFLNHYKQNDKQYDIVEILQEDHEEEIRYLINERNKVELETVNHKFKKDDGWLIFNKEITSQETCFALVNALLPRNEKEIMPMYA